MNHRRSLIVLLLLVGVCRPCHADDEARAEARAETWTYGVWIRDTRVGSARVVLSPMQIQGKPAVKLTVDLELRINTEAGPRESRLEQVGVAMADGTAVRGTKRELENGHVRTQRFTYGPDSAVREEEFLGRSTRVEVETKGPIVDEEIIFVRHLIRNSLLKAGATFDYQAVSFERKRAYRRTLHVDGRTVEKDGAALWRMHRTSELEDDSERETLGVDDAGRVVEMTGGPITMRAIDPSELEFETAATPFGSTVLTEPSISAHHLKRLRSLVVGVRLPDSDTVFRTNGYQEVIGQDGRTFRIRLVPNAPADDSKLTIPVDVERLAVFLRETEAAESKAPKIVEHSTQIVGDTTLAHEAAGRICDWVYKTLGKVLNGAALTALEALQAGEGDCSEHAGLYVALARAAGLPSRPVSGLLLTEDGFVLHAWAESWIGRWVPVDPAWNRVGTGPLYLSLGPSLDDDGVARSSGLQIAATFGGMSIQILELDLDGQRFDATNPKQIWKLPEDPDAIVERIVLRSGLAFRGAEIERDEESVVFRTPYGRTRVARADIDRVEYRRARSNHFESVEHGVSVDLPDGWAFVDESQWPNAQTMAMFKTKEVAHGLLLSESFAGTIKAYFGLLRQSFATIEGTDKDPTSRSLSSSSGPVDALQWNFVSKTPGGMELQYRILTWKVGNRCFRIIVWSAPADLASVGPGMDAILGSIRLR